LTGLGPLNRITMADGKAWVPTYNVTVVTRVFDVGEIFLRKPGRSVPSAVAKTVLRIKMIKLIDTTCSKMLTQKEHAIKLALNMYTTSFTDGHSESCGGRAAVLRGS
jgi:hypothetical protein